MRSISSLVYSKSYYIGKCLCSTERDLILLYLYPPLKKMLIHPYLFQIINGLLNLFGLEMK